MPARKSTRRGLPTGSGSLSQGDRDGHFHVYLVHPDGSGLTELTSRERHRSESRLGAELTMKVTLYTKADCGLCREAEVMLRRISGKIRFGLELVYLEVDSATYASYRDRIPVVAVQW